MLQVVRSLNPGLARAVAIFEIDYRLHAHLLERLHADGVGTSAAPEVGRNEAKVVDAGDGWRNGRRGGEGSRSVVRNFVGDKCARADGAVGRASKSECAD